MGNYRFRFSDMMPNAWFYKLKDMSKTKTMHPVKKNQPKSKKPAAAEKKSHHKLHNNITSQPRYSYNYLTSSSETPFKPGEFYNSPVNRKASDTHFPDSSSRKSSTSIRRNSRRKTVYKPSPRHFSSSVVSPGKCTCQVKVQESPDYFISSSESSLFYSEEEEDDFVDPDDPEEVSWPDSCNCEVTSSTTDIIIDINSNETFTERVEKLAGFGPISELELPPILTKPAAKLHDQKITSEVTKFRTSSEQAKAAHHHHNHQSLSVKIFKELESVRTQKQHRTSPVTRKSSSKNSTGIKLRANSPRIARKRIQAYAARKSNSSSNTYATKPQKRSLSESFIVVKSSLDPQKDFRDSMEEMILENNIRHTKDLEDLLACYLSLNSNEYHDLIVKAFEQVWSDMTTLRL
ncbi:hypothetical protein ACOSQ4_021775 [Xanthoceras sorbifolium]